MQMCKIAEMKARQLQPKKKQVCPSVTTMPVQLRYRPNSAAAVYSSCLQSYSPGVVTNVVLIPTIHIPHHHAPLLHRLPAAALHVKETEASVEQATEGVQAAKTKFDAANKAISDLQGSMARLERASGEYGVGWVWFFQGRQASFSGPCLCN